MPKGRRLVTDIGWMARKKQTIRGLLEIDVTKPREYIRDHRARTGERLSFTAFLAFCAGNAVDNNKYLHAYRDWLGRLVLFDDVDIATMIEIEKEGKKFPIGHIVRSANKKSFKDIHDEIRDVQASPMEAQEVKRYYTIGLMPSFIRRLLFLLLSKSPQLIRQYNGTVVLSALGMFGKGGGWGMALPSHTLGITIGGISEKPGVIDGRIEVREHLHVTLDFDHDIVDGAPAARFAQRFRDLVEGGHGLR